MNFKDLNIIPKILEALEKENYSVPTPIQEQAIPIVLAGRDLLGCAQTGTGKTAAFAVPILQLLSSPTAEKTEPRKIRSLILTPTRELAVQIYESFHSYGRFTKLRACVVFGGVSQKMQVEKLQRGVDILVATPGRLNDLMNQGYINLQNVEILVLDEADRMLDMGFIADVKKIIARIPKQRQTLFFSATMPKEISEMVNTILVDPAKVTITPPATTVEMIDQSVYFVDKDNKRKLLIHILQDKSIRSALVFTRTKHGADNVVKELIKAKISTQAIHGNKSQNARQTALNSFKNGGIRVLVATDIAARGIDIDELSCVINFDLPEVPETYVHRIGRTGRAGLSGIAISFCSIDEKSDLRNIQKLIDKTVPVVEDTPYPMLNTTPTPKSDLHRRRPMAQSFEPRRSAPVKKESPYKNRFADSEKRNAPAKKSGEQSKWKNQYSRKG
jgi:ATP-dependent RNA helicase RhlE